MPDNFCKLNIIIFLIGKFPTQGSDSCKYKFKTHTQILQIQKPMGFEHPQILVCEEGPGTNPLQVLRDNCVFIGKKFRYKWTWAVLTPALQGSVIHTSKIEKLNYLGVKCHFQMVQAHSTGQKKYAVYILVAKYYWLVKGMRCLLDNYFNSYISLKFFKV